MSLRDRDGSRFTVHSRRRMVPSTVDGMHSETPMNSVYAGGQKLRGVGMQAVRSCGCSAGDDWCFSRG